MREKGEFYPSGGVTGPEDLSVVRSPESAGPKNLRRIYLRRENESRGRSAESEIWVNMDSPEDLTEAQRILRHSFFLILEGGAVFAFPLRE